MHRYRNIWIFFCLAWVGTWAVEVSAQGRERSGRRRGEGQFDVAELLGRLDLNKNGVLEAAEMSDRTRGFLERMEIEVGETVVIADVLKKIEERRTGKPGAPSENPAATPATAAPPAGSAPPGSASSATFVRKVPGFDSPPALATTTPNFSVAAASSPTLGQYSDSVREQVESAMRRYDKNGDGILDPEEIKAGRWGAPSAEESDLNHDGNLSRDELANRYLQREQAANASGSSGSTERTSREARGRDRGDENRGGNSPAAGSSGTPAATPSSATTSAPAPRSGDGPNYRDYASGLVEKYDANKDGQLDKEEIKGMRRPPPNADRNNDGLVSLSELTEAFEEQDKNPRSSSPSSSGNGGGRPESPSRSGSDRSRSTGSSRERSSGASVENFSLGAFDKNNDGQVQMWEFATEWTEEDLEKFRKLDKNGDGIISAAEAKK